MLDFILLAILAVVTWCVSGEGVWGAALVFLSTLFGGLIAMNFFEPLANLLSSGGSWDWYWDFLALVVLFGGSVTLLRMATEALMPVYVEVLPLLYDVGRWVLGLATGYVTMAFLATALHTAPLPREFLDFKPEQPMLFGLGADRQWLAFTQYVSENVYRSGRIFDGEQAPAIPEKWQKAGDYDKPGLITTWSSFPMRYAARRSEFIRSSGAAPVLPSTLPPPVAPSGGGGGGSRPNF